MIQIHKLLIITIRLRFKLVSCQLHDVDLATAITLIAFTKTLSRFLLPGHQKPAEKPITKSCEFVARSDEKHLAFVLR